MKRLCVRSTLLIILLGACAPRPAVPLQVPSPAEATDVSTTIVTAVAADARLGLSALENGAYHSPDWGDFQLANGVYYRPTMGPGESPEVYATRFREPVIYGDLNADGVEDALVILSTQNGGTGHFVEMAAVLNRDGRADNVSTLSLGDRVVIEAGRVVEGTVVLEMRVQGPDAGLCCPNQFETWRFRLEGNQLVKLP